MKKAVDISKMMGIISLPTLHPMVLRRIAYNSEQTEINKRVIFNQELYEKIRVARSVKDQDTSLYQTGIVFIVDPNTKTLQAYRLHQQRLERIQERSSNDQADS